MLKIYHRGVDFSAATWILFRIIILSSSSSAIPTKEANDCLSHVFAIQNDDGNDDDERNKSNNIPYHKHKLKT